MLASNYRQRIILAGLALAMCAAPTRADAFKPLRFLQDASVITALGTAVAQLGGCEDRLTYSQKVKGDEGDIVEVTINCNRFPDDNGKLVRAAVSVEFELNEDGSIGAPLEFSYDGLP